MKELDMRGKQCPIPVLEARAALDQMEGVEVLSVRVDNEIAVENLKKLSGSRGAQTEVEKVAENDFRVNIVGGKGTTVAAQTLQASAGETGAESGSEKSSTVVVIASDRMGEPEEELGKILMKGFIYAVSRLEEQPDTMLFYNGGASLTTAQSDSLEDLKEMEAQGVEILTCGTCLKHLGLENSLKAGSVTNMYDIVERMAKAGKIIRP